LKETKWVVPTLAEAVVSARPDLFVLTATGWTLQTTSFGRIEPGIEPLDLEAVRRLRRRFVLAFMFGSLVIGFVAVVVLFLRPAS
jgi:hypothetical protein